MSGRGEESTSHSFVLREKFFSPLSHTDNDVLVHRFDMGCDNVPLHHVYLKSNLVTGFVPFKVCSVTSRWI